MAGCNKEGKQQELLEMSVIGSKIWSWKREEVCESVGKQEDCEERDVIAYVCVSLCFLADLHLTSNNSKYSASVTDIFTELTEKPADAVRHLSIFTCLLIYI